LNPRPASARGWIYILSTRETPDLLKIGVTERTIEERVREINSATGIAIPFGVRAAWEIDEAPVTERDIHRLLADFRIRRDREFFRISFDSARRLINDFLKDRREGAI